MAETATSTSTATAAPGSGSTPTAEGTSSALAAIAARSGPAVDSIVDAILASQGLLAHGHDAVTTSTLVEDLRQQIAGALADGIDPGAIAAVFAAANYDPSGNAVSSTSGAALGSTSGYPNRKQQEYPEECCIQVANLEGGEDEIWPEQLNEHFKACGTIRRIVIKIDKMTGDRSGYAYIDFADEISASTALALDSSPFGDRILKVTRKPPSQSWNYGGYEKGRGKKGRGKGRGKDWWDSGGWGGGGNYWGVTNKNWGRGGRGGGWQPY